MAAPVLDNLAPWIGFPKSEFLGAFCQDSYYAARFVFCQVLRIAPVPGAVSPDIVARAAGRHDVQMGQPASRSMQILEHLSLDLFERPASNNANIQPGK